MPNNNSEQCAKAGCGLTMMLAPAITLVSFSIGLFFSAMKAFAVGGLALGLSLPTLYLIGFFLERKYGSGDDDNCGDEDEPTGPKGPANRYHDFSLN